MSLDKVFQSIGIATLINLFGSVSAPATERSVSEVLEELDALIKEHGATHVYPGARLIDDFFCTSPSRCPVPPEPEESARPTILDRIAGLTDDFVVRLFQETLKKPDLMWLGRTENGDECLADLKAHRMVVLLNGEAFEDSFRFDWRESGDWTRFRVQALGPGLMMTVSEPPRLERFLQIPLTLGLSAAQAFSIEVTSPGRLRLSMRVNRSMPRHLLDWGRRRVVCEFRANPSD
jgi:hypothetical protein